MSEQLQPFQYQIGDIKFGKGTDIVIQSIDMQPYNVNAQDFQLPRSDEVRFGIDSLSPSPIIFSLGVLNNYVMDGMEALAGFDVDDSLLGKSRVLLSDFANEWKANNVRSMWGTMKPLLFCDADGVTRRIYGRPGKFAYAASKRGEQWIDAQAEFRRADTYAYNDIETYVEIANGEDPVWIAQDGDAPAWMRVLMYGPIEHPVITIGNARIELDLVVEAGTVLEVSSYPWMRRVVNSEGHNLRTKVGGSTSYLDEIRMPANEAIPVRWTDYASTEATWTEIPNTKWNENVDFLDMVKLWDTYEAVEGQVFWCGNLVSGGYISAPLGRGAVLDSKHEFSTAGQFAQVRIAADTAGKSALVIASNDTMTNFACVEVENNCNVFSAPDVMRIRTGASPSAMTTQATYTLPEKLGIHDTVGIWRDSNTNTYHAQHNGETVMSWQDAGQIVSPANRRQGFIINCDSTLFSKGCGFDNLVAYDISANPLNTGGKVYVLWRDAYHVV